MYILKLLRVRCFKSADVHIYFGKALNHKNLALEVVFKMCVHVYVFVCAILQLMWHIWWSSAGLSGDNYSGIWGTLELDGNQTNIW